MWERLVHVHVDVQPENISTVLAEEQIAIAFKSFAPPLSSSTSFPNVFYTPLCKFTEYVNLHFLIS